MPEVVVFGAGATGREHVGLHVWQAGCHVTFIDKNLQLVDALAAAGTYNVQLYSEGCRDITVSDFGVFFYEDRDAIAAAVSRADLVLTAVFDQNLSDVAVTLAKAVTASRFAGRTLPLNCIACENMMGSSSVLARLFSLLDDADRAYCDAYFGFPDCMISRVVPRPAPGSLDIIAEDYSEWTANAAEFRGPKPDWLHNLELVDNQDARLERKLFIHNGGHAICGYTGFHRGHRYIHEAVADPVVGECVLGALDELGEVVRRKHGFSGESIDRYKQDLVRRGAVPEMQDEILRVVRDPIRKLSSRERLVAPALIAVEYGLPRRWIIRGIVAALLYSHPADPQSVRLAAMLEQQGLPAVIREVCGIADDSPLMAEIQAEWHSPNPTFPKEPTDMEKMLAAVLHDFNDLRLEETPRPEAVEPGTVVVRIKSCGFCATDYKAIKGIRRNVTFPFIPGHEPSGIVSEVGPGVLHFKPGDDVICQPSGYCGYCQNCRIGNTHYCEHAFTTGGDGPVDVWPGAFAEYMLTSENMLFHKPPEVSFDAAALTEPLSGAWKGVIQYSEMKLADDVVVIGTGGIGLLCLMVAAAAGAGRLVAVDTSDYALGNALRLGATHTVNPAKEDPRRCVYEIMPEGPDLIVEAAGPIQAVQLMVDLRRRGTRWNVFGITTHEKFELDGGLTHFLEGRMDASFGTTPVAMANAIRLMARGLVDPEKIVSHRFPLTEIHRAIEVQALPDRNKVIINP